MSLPQRVHWIALVLVGMMCGIVVADDAFEAAAFGSLPSGWSAAKTGSGDGSVWKIQEDLTSPSGKKVLTQTSSAGSNNLFNLCVASKPTLADVHLRVALKPLTGKIDLGGGLVWRYQDENNYYVVRWNPLEGDFRLFEMDTEAGKVTRLFSFDPPADNTANQEVTYHGVEAIGNNIVLAVNEGRSYVDAVDVSSGKLLDRLTAVNKPCCVERIPASPDQPVRVLISNIGDATLQLVEVAANGKMKALGRSSVGKAPKRVAFVPVSAP